MADDAERSDRFVLDIGGLTDEQRTELKQLLMDFASGADAQWSEASEDEVEGFVARPMPGFEIAPRPIRPGGLGGPRASPSVMGHVSHNDDDGWV